MEVGPWRWDGKSEHDFWIKPGGWEEYATIVYGASFYAFWTVLRPKIHYHHSGSACRYRFLLHEHRSLRSYIRHRKQPRTTMVLNVVIMSNHLDASSANRIHEELLRGLPGI
jgi:hypothetical protein